MEVLYKTKKKDMDINWVFYFSLYNKKKKKEKAKIGIWGMKMDGNTQRNKLNNAEALG